jgi:hypothetical protein
MEHINLLSKKGRGSQASFTMKINVQNTSAMANAGQPRVRVG